MRFACVFFLTLLIAITAQIKDEAADGIRGVKAVADHRVPSLIALRSLILPESFQQIGERLLGNIFIEDGLAQRYENRMRRLAFITKIEFAFPPIEKFEGARGVRDFIAEVVGPAAVRINVVEMLVEFFRQEPGDDIEILVVVSGEPLCELLSPLRRTLRRRGLRGDL